MKVIYVAGHYRDNRGEYYVRMNIRTAERAALFVWLNGGVALCPHKNTAGYGGAHGILDKTWLLGDIELLARCDALWALPGWDTSKGATKEVEYAKSQEIIVLYNQNDVLKFLNKI
ncbi:unnamed protein product [marine sediment metagenome]|uniref:DUF1937 domain-containing protein n=1 Tax=marine sediment metagenome TaxID=412755 RepID=X1BW48_9ZZZZ